MIKVSYVPLFTRLLERKIPKMEFCRLSGISHSTLARLAKDGSGVSMDIIAKACFALRCTVQEVVEVTFNE